MTHFCLRILKATWRRNRWRNHHRINCIGHTLLFCLGFWSQIWIIFQFYNHPICPLYDLGKRKLNRILVTVVAAPVCLTCQMYFILIHQNWHPFKRGHIITPWRWPMTCGLENIIPWDLQLCITSKSYYDVLIHSWDTGLWSCSRSHPLLPTLLNLNKRGVGVGGNIQSRIVMPWVVSLRWKWFLFLHNFVLLFTYLKWIWS